VLAVLRRETGYARLALRGLGYGEVAEYLTRAAEREPGSTVPFPQALAQTIYDETAGNPFVVHELFRHLVEEGKIVRRAGQWSSDFSMAELGIPEGVREVVGRRVARLSEATRNLLRLAAALNGGFEFRVAQALTELPEETLLDALDEALRAGLLCALGGTPPTYDFAHAIVRHTLYDALNPDRQARLHRRIAAALEQVYAGREREDAAELAAQYHASAALPGAAHGIPYALAAAEQARAGYASERAAAFLRMAHDQARAAAACRMPMLHITSLPWADVAPLRALCPQLVTGQTVGAGHFHQLEVPEQVNAMIDRFLANALMQMQPEAMAVA
jgi:predicted ATPase